MKLNYFFYSKTRKNWNVITRSAFHNSEASLEFWARHGTFAPLPELDSCAIMIVVNDDRPDTAAKLSDYAREEVGAIIAGEGTNYGAHVLRLVKKADAYQREVLRMVYPDHVAAVEAWEISASPRLPLSASNSPEVPGA